MATINRQPEAVHQHSLDDIVGYDVVETIAPDGERVRNVVGHIDGAHRFGEALVAARTYRIGCGYARAIAIYSCGCTEG